MRSVMTLLVIGGAFLTWPAHASERAAEEPGTILEVAAAAGSFKTLKAALEAAELVPALEGEGPFTVFAPTDTAFGALPEGTVAGLLESSARSQLQQILTYHVVPGRYDSREMLALGELTTLQGAKLKVALTSGRLTVNGVAVNANDVEASNGIIHGIEKVLLPPTEEPQGDLAGARDLIVLSIERGVPLFNQGQREACAAVYEVAVQALIALGDDLPEALQSHLRAAMRAARGTQDAASRAWTLRRALDRALSEIPPQGSAGTASSDPGATRVASQGQQVSVFEFESQERAGRWYTVNDDVMGGISRSKLVLSEDGTALFRGQLSLENNGGFATVRCAQRDLGLAGTDGLVLRVRGDGRTYGLSGMKTDNRWDVNTWTRRFETQAGEWQEVRIPFRQLVHTVMGQKVPGSGPLAPADLRTLSFIIADKDESPFELEIDWIRAYQEISPQ